MKLVCTQSDLSTNLSLTSRAVPSRPTHPVLANVLLQADAETNQVSLTAFDLSLGIRTSFSAEVLHSGEIAIPAKLLNDITARLPEGEITLENESASIDDPLAGEGSIVTLIPKSGRYQVRAMGGVAKGHEPSAIRLGASSRSRLPEPHAVAKIRRGGDE